MTINRHEIQLTLPIKGGQGSMVKLDGEKLTGVLSVDVRAAKDEITAVTLELESTAALKLTAMIAVKVLNRDDLNGLLGSLLGECLSEANVQQYRGRVPAGCPLDNAALMFLELLIENSGVIE